MSFAILSMFFFSSTYALYKACGPFLNPFEVVLLQSIFSGLLIAPIVLPKGAGFWRTPHWKMMIWRTAFGLGALVCIVQAVKTTELVEVNALNATSPFVVSLLLWLLHKKRLSIRLFSLLVVGFLGVLCILQPGFAILHQGHIFALASALFSACMLIVVKHLAHEPSLRILSWQYPLVCILSLPFALANWQMPSINVCALLFLAALTNLAAQRSLIEAARRLSAHAMAPFNYFAILFSGLLGWIFWNQTPDLLSLLGVCLIAASGITTALLSKNNT